MLGETLLPLLADEVEAALRPEQCAVPDAYTDFVRRWNPMLGLVAPKDLPLIEDKLAARVSFAEEEGPAWIDVQPHAINFATFTFDPSGPLVEDVGGTDVTDLRVTRMAGSTPAMW